VNVDLVADPLHVCADVGEELQHRFDVEDPRHVPQDDRLARQQARSENREGAVLVPGCADAPGERAATFDHERFGRAPDHGGLGHRGSLPT
jgi:hypothetical protein